MNKTLLAVVALGLLGTVAFAEDLVDNPAYQNWAKYKVGATQKMSMTNTVRVEEQDMVTSGTTTVTLKELTPDKAVIEIAAEMTVSGQVMKMPAQKQELKAKVPAADAHPAAPPDAKMTKLGSGEEEITVAGKKYNCHWEQWQTESKQMKMISKFWTSKDVPGGVVKSESSGDMTPGGKMSSKMELLEFKDGA